MINMRSRQSTKFQLVIMKREWKRHFFHPSFPRPPSCLLLLGFVLKIHRIAHRLPLLVVQEAGCEEEVHVKVGAVLMVHVRLKPEEDDIDEDDNNVLEEPVHVKIPVGNYPSAEKAAHSTGWGRVLILTEFLPLRRFSKNWPLLCDRNLLCCPPFIFLLLLSFGIK